MAFQVEGTVYVQRLRGTKGPGMSRWKVECSVWLHYTLRVQGVQKVSLEKCPKYMLCFQA